MEMILGLPRITTQSELVHLPKSQHFHMIKLSTKQIIDFSKNLSDNVKMILENTRCLFKSKNKFAPFSQIKLRENQERSSARSFILVSLYYRDYVQFLENHQVSLTSHELQVLFTITYGSYKVKLYTKLDKNPVFFVLPSHCWL